MCNSACLEFGCANLHPNEVTGKSVIEVGSIDVNGSLRTIVNTLAPGSYLGVDIRSGPGVDLICNATELLTRFGRECFEVLICTEVLEHIYNWRQAVSNFKHILRPQGILLITTRSKGFGLHEYPADFWRFEVEDMQAIFSDFEIEVISRDHLGPGVFIKARKPDTFQERDLTNQPLYSIIKDRRTTIITRADWCWFLIRCGIWYRTASIIQRLISRILPASWKRIIRERVRRT